MDRLSKMGVFAAVVRTGSFTAAAEELGIAKSTVSRQVGELESSLGAQLLHRNTRQIRATEIGKRFYTRCVRMLDEAEDAARDVLAHVEHPRGVLHVGAPPFFARHYLGAPLASYLQAHPAVDVHLRTADRFNDMVGDGLDLVIRLCDGNDSSLIARRLGPSRRWLVASPEYLERRGTPTHPNDLSDHDILVRSRRPTIAPWVLSGPRGQVRFRPRRARLVANHGDPLVPALVAGLGISIAPDFLVKDHLDNGRLVTVLEDWSIGDAQWMQVVFPHRRNLAPHARAFVDHLVAAFASAPPWYWEKKELAPKAVSVANGAGISPAL